MFPLASGVIEEICDFKLEGTLVGTVSGRGCAGFTGAGFAAATVVTAGAVEPAAGAATTVTGGFAAGFVAGTDVGADAGVVVAGGVVLFPEPVAG